MFLMLFRLATSSRQVTKNALVTLIWIRGSPVQVLSSPNFSVVFSHPVILERIDNNSVSKEKNSECQALIFNCYVGIFVDIRRHFRAVGVVR